MIHCILSRMKMGNTLQLLANFSTFKLNLISTYTPNRDSPNFFEKILQLSQNETTDYVMICDDFNLVLNPSIDCHNYTNIYNPRVRSKVTQMMNDLDLTDSFHYLNTNLKRFSWRKNPLKEASLIIFSLYTQ